MFGLTGIQGAFVAILFAGAVSAAFVEFVKAKVLPLWGIEMPRKVKVFSPVALAMAIGAPTMHFELGFGVGVSVGLSFLAGTKATWLYDAFWKTAEDKLESV